MMYLCLIDVGTNYVMKILLCNTTSSNKSLKLLDYFLMIAKEFRNKRKRFDNYTDDGYNFS